MWATHAKQTAVSMFKIVTDWGTRGAQNLTLDLGPCHDLTVRGTEPRVGLCTGGLEPA